MSDPIEEGVCAAELDLALERLRRELAQAGLPPIAAASNATILPSIEDAIAPLRLPGSVKRFWELVDPGPIAVSYHLA